MDAASTQHRPVPDESADSGEPDDRTRVDVDELTVALVAGSNVIVAGPRRSGKTSVCDAAPGRVVADGLQTTAIVNSKAQLGEEPKIAFGPGRSARDPRSLPRLRARLPGRSARAD